MKKIFKVLILTCFLIVSSLVSIQAEPDCSETKDALNVCLGSLKECDLIFDKIQKQKQSNNGVLNKSDLLNRIPSKLRTPITILLLIIPAIIAGYNVKL